ANIALIKYWGKADAALKIPAVGSISITLDALWSETEVRFDERLASDQLSLDGAARPEQLARVSACLDLLRQRAGVTARASIVSRNNFPTGAGLASSASGFAALVGAGARALGLELTPRELSIAARQGSGSAARSVFGGFVEMHAGAAADGGDSYAEPLLPADAWPLEVVVAITARGEKDVGSGPGMARSEASSPYYPAWVAEQPADLAGARRAIEARDFDLLADLAEHSCLKMHAAAMAARPPLLYWNGVTVECVHAVRSLRRRGVPVFFTIDAGPQVKAVCAPGARSDVEAELAGVPGVLDVLVTGLGPGLETG
ncbi:MAG: diphosphomevalonate decarboxylase, partial [Gammaproteobacteria bacterium]|nr:diphosphomevalonate decarboxylase [Gammaproteobacteria bacterium]